jgi:hypothetical protein
MSNNKIQNKELINSIYELADAIGQNRDEPLLRNISLSESIERAGIQMSAWTFDNDNSITQGLFAISDSINKLAKSIDDLRR